MEGVGKLTGCRIALDRERKECHLKGRCNRGEDNRGYERADAKLGRKRHLVTRLKIGNIMPWSEPASAYRTIGKTMGDYFGSITDNGGGNGRRINFISLDDA